MSEMPSTQDIKNNTFLKYLLVFNVSILLNQSDYNSININFIYIYLQPDCKPFSSDVKTKYGMQMFEMFEL